jgi:glycyl-tRNA synthetase
MQKKITTIQQHKQVLDNLKHTEKTVEELGTKIKHLKEQKSEKVTLDPIISQLKHAKEHVVTLTKEYVDTDPNKLHIIRPDFEDLMTRRFFYIPAFEIYGGVGGLYDYGPSCCAIKSNLLTLWRNHFTLQNLLISW